MGCDIHVFGEKRGDNGAFQSVDIEGAFGNRSYSSFAFFAGVRNYSGVTPIAKPRGFPEDAATDTRQEFELWDSDAHNPSWLTIEELLAFDYSATIEDRRVTVPRPYGYDHGGTCGQGGGVKMQWREYLGEGFFRDLEEVKALGAERIVFWFDN
jgi:hypothetical protein